MTNLRNSLLAAAFAACLPAVASTQPPPVNIDFEHTATPVIWLDNNGNPSPGNVNTGYAKDGTGDGFGVGSFYASGAENYGVTFDDHAYSFYAYLDAQNRNFGLNVANLPLLPGGAPNLVVMSPFTVAPADRVTPDCLQYGFPCADPPMVSTKAEVTVPYVSVSFSYSASSGSSPFVNVWSGPSRTGALMAGSGELSDVFSHRAGCSPTSTEWWCDWQTVTIQLGSGQPNWSIEFGGQEGGVVFDNIVFGVAAIPTPTPEPATYVMALLGLSGVGLFANRRRRRS
jgi:hypothetical protein